MSDKQIHPTAIVAPGAVIDPSVSIGPYCVVGEPVVIGEGTTIGPHSVIGGFSRIGRNNRIMGQVAIGSAPQDLKYDGEETWVEIGDNNVIREFVTINRGTTGGGRKTVVGSDSLLMTAVHVAHDCHVGNEVIMANAATLAGHVHVADFSTVGAFVGVHQFCRVGSYAFIGGYSVITRDALPFVKTVGIRNEAKTYDINTLGLERRGFSRERIVTLQRAYRILFRKGLRTSEAIARIRADGLETQDVALLVRFIEESERGFIR